MWTMRTPAESGGHLPMFKSESIPTWLCVAISALQMFFQYRWRMEDMKQPIPDVRYWFSTGVTLIAILIALVLRFAPRRDPFELVILRASWGGGYWWQFRRIPVKELLQATADRQNNSLDLPVANDSFGDWYGDPLKGTYKTLRIKYSYGGMAPRTKILREGDRLILPEPDVRAKVRAMFEEPHLG
jgi:hypothetical protein